LLRRTDFATGKFELVRVGAFDFAVKTTGGKVHGLDLAM
jgi:hypothetical protein